MTQNRARNRTQGMQNDVLTAPSQMPHSIMLAEISNKLFARRPENDVDFKLDRVYEVLHLLGDPHLQIKCVHIAGTNGKSSTTMMTERLLRLCGLTTACFTSPHINRLTERILINGVEVNAAKFINAYEKVIAAVEIIENEQPTLGRLGFFEVITIIAFDIFASTNLDVCVIEVGLGGLLDATNVIKEPLCSVITPIGIDHTDYLGETLAEIAQQKAGILKQGVEVVLAEQEKGALEVILKIANDLNCEVIRPKLKANKLNEVEKIADLENNSLYTPQFINDNLKLAISAATISLSKTKGLALNASLNTIYSVLVSNYASITQVSGRFECKTKQTDDNDHRLIYDVAHNPHGAYMLHKTLVDYSITHKFRKLFIILSIFEDKDVAGYIKALCEGLEFNVELVITKNSSPRALNASKLTRIAKEVIDKDNIQITRIDDIDEAFRYATKSASDNDLILVTGSFITVSDLN